ncbi:hypothetical protein [Ostreiculturibacter nitratireducens]|uniref:RCC1 domain-containing protein n=1 Tax=Ostreiculturibacter nitratireducens TaxID=3075226 RepID=UPI0031B64D97
MRLISAVLALALPASGAAAAEVIDIDVAEAHGCALYDDGAVWCWGDFPGTELELPFSAWPVDGLPAAKTIATGRFGACAVDHGGDLWCWGFDLQRSLRNDDFTMTLEPFRIDGLPRVKAVDLGFVHYCAISIAGEVWCWGDNPCGELGCGDREPRVDPTRVLYVLGARAVSAGVNNTCVVLWSGQLSCWGSDNPTMVGKPFIYESSEPLLFDMDAAGPFRTVSNGRNFACGILTSGEVTCFGSNIMGQIGTEEPRLGEGWSGIGEVDGITKAEDLDTSYFNACAVQGGKVICWGAPLFTPVEVGEMAQLPKEVPGIEGATRVALGPVFGCAVTGGRVMCWGTAELFGSPLIKGMTPDQAAPVPGLP